MISFAGVPAQVKVLLYLMGSALLIQGLLYATGGCTLNTAAHDTNTNTDNYVLTIQKNSDIIARDVNDIVAAQGTKERLVYWHGCEIILGTVRTQNLEAEQSYRTVSDNHRVINEEYREFLHEAANVLIACENGETPNTSEMEKKRVKLHQQ